MHDALFGKVLHMSLLGCYSLAVVLPIRFFLMRCGRKYAYYLWLIVFFNLCIPVSLYSSVSLIPRQVADFSFEYGSDPVREEAAEHADSAAQSPVRIHVMSPDGTVLSADETGKDTGDGAEELTDRAETDSPKRLPDMEPRIKIRKAAEYVWLTGMLILFIYNLLSVLRLNRCLSQNCRTSWEEKERIAEVDGIGAPFLWGLFRPVIYLPAGMKEKEKNYIIAHEKCHRRRKDHIVKLLICGGTILHWFNPLVWLAYSLCSRDMEISCDEEVLARSEENIRKAYAESLLKYAAKQNGYMIKPLTFGEPSVKSRIRNVLQYKKKGAAISALAALCVCGAAAGLLLRPKEDGAGLPPDAEAETDYAWEEPEENSAGEVPDEVPDDSAEKKGNVVNNGGEVLQVNGRLFYMSGQKLYSNGRKLYTSLTEADGTWAVYACELDGSGFEKLMDGRIVGWADDWDTPYVWTTVQDAEGMEEGKPGMPGLYILGELDLVSVAYTTDDFLGVDGQYAYFSRKEEDGIYLDCYWAGDGRIEKNVLGTALPVQMITDFHAEGDYLLLAAGEVQGSGGFFCGDFYSYNRTPGRLFQEHLTDANTFAAMNGYIYYQKYSDQGDGANGLFRVSYDLTGEEAVGDDLTFCAFDGTDGTILAAKQVKDADAGGIRNLVRINPDGSGEQVLLNMEQMLESPDGEEGTARLGTYLDWEWEKGDKIQFSEINLLQDMFSVKAEHWGSREEADAGWRDSLIEEVYFQVKTDGSDFEIWDPQIQAQ